MTNAEADRAVVFSSGESAGTESPVQVEEGRAVSFAGTVRAVPPASESASRHPAGLTPMTAHTTDSPRRTT